MKYEIKGEPLPVVICQLEQGEGIRCEAGAMSWMSSNLSFATAGGGVGKMFGRAVSGESLFQNTYVADSGPGMIAFASKFPGSIRAFEISPEKPIVVQKKGFLAASQGVDLSVFFQKKISSGIFGGEGFIMEKISGNGLAFVELDGSAIEYDLQAGQTITVDTGHVAMVDASVSIDIVRIKGVKNMLFGGEGLFNTVLTGPGHVVLQTMPMSVFAGEVAKLIPSGN